MGDKVRKSYSNQSKAHDYETQLSNLVELVLDDNQPEEKIKAAMHSLGIPDSGDPIERLNQILIALHSKKNSNLPNSDKTTSPD